MKTVEKINIILLIAALAAAVALPAFAGVTGSSRPEIFAEFSSDAGIDRAKVQMLLDDADVTSEAAITSWRVSYTPREPLSPGKHDVVVRVEDSKGRKLGKHWTFVIDPNAKNAQPPAITFAPPTPRNGAVLSAENLPAAISANIAGGPDGAGIDPASIELSVSHDGGPAEIVSGLIIGGETASTGAGSSGGIVLTKQLGVRAPGTYLITISAADTLQNRARPAQTAFSIDDSPPEIHGVKIFSSATPKPSIQIAAFISDEPFDTLDSWTASIRKDGAPVIEISGPARSGGNVLAWDAKGADGSPAPAGRYQLIVSCADLAGHAAKRPPPLEFDLGAGEIPVVAEVKSAAPENQEHASSNDASDGASADAFPAGFAPGGARLRDLGVFPDAIPSPISNPVIDITGRARPGLIIEAVVNGVPSGSDTADGSGNFRVTNVVLKQGKNDISLQVTIPGDSAIPEEFKLNSPVLLVSAAPMPNAGPEQPPDAGQGGQDGGGTPPIHAPAHISLSADITSLPADGRGAAAIEADVTDAQGHPVADGTSIDFTVSIGAITSPATTDGGTARTTLTAPTIPGTAEIAARAGDVSARMSIVFTEPPPGPPASITVTAAPTDLPADGRSKSSIRARVTDADGKPVADGTAVNFSATAGAITSSAATRAGIAEAVYTAGNVSGVSDVTASVAGVSGGVQIFLMQRPGKPVITRPSNKSVAGDSSVEVQGQAEPESTVEIFVNGNPAGTAVANPAGHFNFPKVPLAEGSNALTATATNRSGVSDISDQVFVTLVTKEK